MADSLAKNSLNHAHGVVAFDSLPIHSSQAFLVDIDGIPRGCDYCWSYLIFVFALWPFRPHVTKKNILVVTLELEKLLYGPGPYLYGGPDQ